MKKRIGIVWANPNNLNLGVGALAYSAYSLVEDVCKENNIDTDILFVGAGNPSSNEFSILDRKIKYKNVKGMDFMSIKSFLKFVLLPWKFHTRSVLSLDILFDVGEGDSFTDIYGDARFRRFLNSKIFFQKLGKKQVLFPQTIGPFKKKDHEQQAFGVMKKIHKIISRDNTSYEYTRQFLRPEQLLEAVDIAFYMPFKRPVFASDSIHVGINVSGLLWNGGYSKDNQFNLTVNYTALMKKIIEFFLAQPNVTLHFVPHVVTMDGGTEDDHAVCKILHETYPGTVLAPEFKSPIEAKSYISGMQFFTGARMHACIAAFSSGVPVFPLGYSRKFTGLFIKTLEYPFMSDCTAETDDQVLDKISNAFINRNELGATIIKSQSAIIEPRLNSLKEVIINLIKE